MFKVLLIDDEPWALKIIEKGFNWSRFGFEIIGKHNSAEGAMEHILKDEPDVVLTDIRIAGDSGIDLIKLVRDKELDIEFVVISGYADFHVAQSAIKLGVFDFLLKPIDLDEGDAFLEKLSDHLRYKSSEKQIQLNKRYKNMSVAEFINSSHIKTDSGIIRAITIRGISQSEVENLRLDKQNLIKTGHNKFTFILDSSNYFESSVFKTLADIKEKYSIGICNPIVSGDHIQTAIIRSDIMSYQDFITGKSDIFFYSSSHYKEIVSLAESIISEVDKSDSTTEAGDFYSNILQTGYNVQDLTQLFNYLVASSRLSIQDTELADYIQLCEKFADAKSLLAYIINNLNIPHSSVQPSENSFPYMQLLNFANNNYTKNISLTAFSQKMNISPSYLSEIFSRNCGMSFTKYINNLRNTRAKELLSSTALSIQEIAELSGFNDYFYFSAQFKKNFQMTPSEYRSRSKTN